MGYISGTLRAGSEIILDSINVEIMVERGGGKLGKWYGHFVVPVDATFSIVPPRTLELELEDGRRGKINPENIDAHTHGTAVYFKGLGPLKAD